MTDKEALQGIAGVINGMQQNGMLENIDDPKVQAKMKRDEIRERARIKALVAKILAAGKKPNASAVVSRLVKREIAKAEFQG